MAKPVKIVPDQGWSWAVLIASFFSMFLVDGIIHSFGILYLELLDYFGESRSATSWVGSLLPGIQGISGPIVSALINKFGCRTMTILGSITSALGFFCASFATSIWMLSVFYGIFGGVGFSLMYISGFVMISQYFEKRRAFAMGFSSCGSGVGTFVFAPLTSKLLDSFGWRGGLWIISAIVLNGVVCGAMYRPGVLVSAEEEEDSNMRQMNGRASPEKDCKKGGGKQKEHAEEKPTLEFSLLLKPVFLVFCVATFVMFIGNFVPYIFLPDLARKHNIDRDLAAWLPSIIGITNTAGRLICGTISDRSWADPLKIFSFSLVIVGILTCCVSLFHTFPLLAFYAVLFGLCIGAYMSLFAVILVELLGLESLSSALGFVSVFCGTAALSGAPLAGSLFDITGDYDVAFYAAGTCIGLAGFMMMPLRLVAKMKFPCVEKPRQSIPTNCSREPFIMNGDTHQDCLESDTTFNKRTNTPEKVMNGEMKGNDVAVNGLKKSSESDVCVS